MDYDFVPQYRVTQAEAERYSGALGHRIPPHLLPASKNVADVVDVTLPMQTIDAEGNAVGMQPFVRLSETDVRRVRLQKVLDREGVYRQLIEKSPGEWQEYEGDEPGELVVRGIGSSELMDMDGDIMRKAALERMTQTRPGLMTWIEHTLSDDSLFGGLVTSPLLTYREPDERGIALNAEKGYAAIEIESDVETDNRRAMRLYKYLKKGRPWGWSIGCFYTDVEPIRNRVGKAKGVYVNDLIVAEWSVVPIPSNQQSWVEMNVKSMVKKGWLVSEDTTHPENLYRMTDKNALDLGPIIGPRIIRLRKHLETAGMTIAFTQSRSQ